jgi:hypothetical protein
VFGPRGDADRSDGADNEDLTSESRRGTMSNENENESDPILGEALTDDALAQVCGGVQKVREAAEADD